ncbi:MAG: hypothetical protein JRN34_03835 [Nitrososphaerota archaeon]|nr:hypothetical protein [Nitrososphaerota archaeon]MDG6942037.1 hypothetical protein [Nitrososphaerota archaeon]MDG6942502.1 hypothetical protein [Nitrososphaerota archaeon]MDG6948289.1 hypothetical protein [Nitrososphaerota archaeon]
MVVQANIATILDSLLKSDLDEAKRRIQALLPTATSEKERGSLMAAAGILASITKGKDGTLQTWDSAKVERAAKSITSNQMADDFDRGYADTLLSYSKLRADTQRTEG